MTRRRWIADQWDANSAVLLDTAAAHLARVLRAQPGQEFDIVAGGAVRRGVIETVSEERVEFSLHEKIDAAESLPLVMVLGIVRFERFEWAIEKLTELGVGRIVPLIAERSEKHLANAAVKRVERWRKIARESAQQSRRSDVPEISEPATFSEFSAAPPDGLQLLLSENERVHTIRGWLEETPRALSDSSTEKIYAAVGPEGGWTEMELAAFARHGWLPVSLGPRILRAETAAIAMASVLSAMLSG